MAERKSATNVDVIEQQKAEKAANIKRLVIDVIDKGLIDIRRGGLLAAVLAMDDQDGKCGCRDVCGCKSGCVCSVEDFQQAVVNPAP